MSVMYAVCKPSIFLLFENVQFSQLGCSRVCKEWCRCLGSVYIPKWKQVVTWLCKSLQPVTHQFFLVFCVNLLTAGNLSTILSLLSIIQSPVGKSLELMQRPKWPSVEDDLWWKTNFGGRRPSVEDDLLWKTPFVGTRPSVEDYLWWKTTLVGSLHTSYSALRHFLSKDLVQIFQLHRICVQYDMMVIM